MASRGIFYFRRTAGLQPGRPLNNGVLNFKGQSLTLEFGALFYFSEVQP
jgi:hypothetical protein